MTAPRATNLQIKAVAVAIHCQLQPANGTLMNRGSTLGKIKCVPGRCANREAIAGASRLLFGIPVKTMQPRSMLSYAWDLVGTAGDCRYIEPRTLPVPSIMRRSNAVLHDQRRRLVEMPPVILIETVPVSIAGWGVRESSIESRSAVYWAGSDACSARHFQAICLWTQGHPIGEVAGRHVSCRAGLRDCWPATTRWAQRRLAIFAATTAHGLACSSVSFWRYRPSHRS